MDNGHGKDDDDYAIAPNWSDSDDDVIDVGLKRKHGTNHKLS